MPVSDPTNLVILILALGLSSFATLFSWQRKAVAGARTFALNSFIGVLHSLCLFLLVFSPTAEVALFSLRLRAILQMLAVTTFVLFILDYAGFTQWLSLRRFWIFLVFPVLAILITLSPLVSQWMFVDYTVQRQDFLLYEHYQSGPLLTLALIYGFVLYLVMLVILGIQSARSQPPFRWQALILFAVVAFTTFITIPSLSSRGVASPFVASPLTLQIIFRSVLITWALFSFKFLDIMPIASYAIIDGMRTAVILLDSQKRIVMMNRAALELATVNQPPPVGQTVPAILPALSDVCARYDGNNELNQEIVFGPVDNPHWFECQLYPLVYAGKRQVGHLLWLRDITARKETESAIRKLSLAVEQSPTSIVITDKAGRIEYVNQHFVNLTGYTLEEATGENPRLLSSGKTPLATYQDMWATILGGQVWTGEFLNKKKNAEFYWEKAVIAPVMDEHREITHFVAVKEDITQQKRVEAERDQLIADLEAYAHTVAHDLKSPVGVLMGFSELLLDPVEHLADSERIQYLETISKTSHKMHNIIDELLLLSSVRTQSDIPISPQEMPVIVQSVLGRLESEIKDAAAKVTVHGDLPPANGYAPWVEEVWVNYISNAIKYGGTPPEIEIGADVQGDKVRYWVRDNGQGLDADQQSRLFQKFSRVTQTRAEGHGLGLSIVQRIMDKLDGHVGVESEVGKGSTFYFVLPCGARREPGA